MTNLKIAENVLSHQYGVQVNGGQTSFSVWSPSSKSLHLYLYKDAKAIRRKKIEMKVGSSGIWQLLIDEDLTGKFYTYLVDGQYEIVDPYCHSTNGNSTKGAIVNAYTVEPEGFKNHKIPKKLEATESFLYEVHVKDFSMGKETDFYNKGLYLGFTEEGLTYHGEKIGIDHLVELGITHVHLLPIYDFISVNDFDAKGYNWGYDPYLFNALEGSYSTNPDDPLSRILEFKQLVMTLHQHDIRVVLDVVYNHTYFGGSSNFHRLMPHVFHRTDGKNLFYNGSGCGNELRTEHPFVEKFIIDSLIYWLRAFKVDGFRFDLMGLYDTGFVKKMSKALNEEKPGILLYGEPWCGGPAGLAHDKQFLKGKQAHLGIALFNDDFRNNIKGSNDGTDAGFVGNKKYRRDDVLAGCFGSVHFSDEIVGFAQLASESINYVSSHDNLILMDKFTKAFPTCNFEEKQNMNALAMTLVIMSFGVPFIQAGTEMLRSKYGYHNSYNSGYYINRLHWENKSKHRHVFDYIKALITFRKSQKVFGLTSAEAIRECVTLMPSQHGTIYYIVDSPFETDERIHIIYNQTFNHEIYTIKNVKLEVDGALYYKEHVHVEGDQVHVPKLSAAILTEKNSGMKII